MNKKSQKKQIRKIKKEIEKFRKIIKRLELRPCKNDAEILQKEKEIEDVKKRIRLLENDRDRHIYTWWQNKKVVYHGNVKTEKFHKPTCKYYNWKNCVAIFHARTEAIEAGYSPCKICKA